MLCKPIHDQLRIDVQGTKDVREINENLGVAIGGSSRWISDIGLETTNLHYCSSGRTGVSDVFDAALADLTSDSGHVYDSSTYECFRWRRKYGC